MKRLLILVLGLVSGVTVCFAQSDGGATAPEKTKTPAVQSVGVEILPFSMTLDERQKADDFYSKADLLLFYERGSRLRFRAEGGLSMLSLMEEGASVTRMSPGASVAFGYRIAEKRNMRSFFTGYIGVGTQYVPDHGLNRKIFLDTHYSYYLTTKLGFNALLRFANYNMSDVVFLMVGAGLTYTL